MIIIDCVQGEPEWFAARLGIPTASEFNKVITPAKMEASKSTDTYINKLVAEWLRGMADESFQSDWMKRGHEVEEEARDYYAFRFDVEVKQVGFCLEDAKRFGCSPDGLIGEDGGVEIKCCSAGVHVGYLLANKVPTEYRLQVLGSLLVTGREWWDFLSFHPDMEPLIVRTHYKDVIPELAKLGKALVEINRQIYEKKQKATEIGLKQ